MSQSTQNIVSDSDSDHKGKLTNQRKCPEPIVEPILKSNSTAVPLSSSQIKQMMAKAQQDIDERKLKIAEMKSCIEKRQVQNLEADERQKRIDILRASIQAKISCNVVNPIISFK